VISLIALILYASAQLTAGSKAMHVLLGWDYSYGIVIGALIVLLYCFAGGIRASIWTDAAQIVVMYGAMTILAIVSLNTIGGFEGLFNKLEAIDPKLVSILPVDNPYGPLMFILGWLSLGFSFIGFPHVMARFMALDSPKKTKQAIYWYEGSYALFYITAYVVALCTRVLLPEAADFDKELALPQLAQQMLPEVLVGVIFAGIFAATISTADSLVLSCTASISRDLKLFDKYKESYRFLKICTLIVTAVASILAIYVSKSVFDMVLLAITVMACGFTPLLILRCFKVTTHPAVLLITIITGLRLENGLTQKDIANVLGVSFQQVQKYETGQNKLPIESLLYLKGYYGTSFETFFAGLGNGTTILGNESVTERINMIRDGDARKKLFEIAKIIAA
jgi:sodium/proline symporter